jgi:hypothetical protein
LCIRSVSHTASVSRCRLDAHRNRAIGHLHRKPLACARVRCRHAAHKGTALVGHDRVAARKRLLGTCRTQAALEVRDLGARSGQSLCDDQNVNDPECRKRTGT